MNKKLGRPTIDFDNGTFDELMAIDGIFKEMYEKQAINYLAGAKHDAGIFAMGEEVEA